LELLLAQYSSAYKKKLNIFKGKREMKIIIGIAVSSAALASVSVQAA